MILNRNSFKATSNLLLAIFILLFAGCGQKTKISGPEFVSKDILVQVIADIHIMDGLTNDMKYYRKFNPGDSVDLYLSIFEKYDIERDMYELTINEYSKYPKLLDEVYDEVLMNLNLLQDKIEEEKREALDNKLAPKK